MTFFIRRKINIFDAYKNKEKTIKTVLMPIAMCGCETQMLHRRIGRILRYVHICMLKREII